MATLRYRIILRYVLNVLTLIIPLNCLLYEGHKSWTPQLVTQMEYTLKGVFVDRCQWIINIWVTGMMP